jgi:phenylacetate-CoA ligase
MPLIRYRVEDMGVPSDRSCACGRGLPLMERLTGRQADFLKRSDGSLVAGVSLIERTLTAIPGIEQMQLIQNNLHELCVRVVKDNGFDKASERTLRAEFREVFGPEMRVDIKYVSLLEQTHLGKYRFAICNV